MSSVSTLPTLPPEAIPSAFPFFLEWDTSLILRSCGPSISKACPGARPGSPLAETFRVLRPEGDLSCDLFRGGSDTLYLLETCLEGLKLRGQIIELEERGSFLMLATPWISDADEIQRHGLSMGDFAPHDQTMDLMHMMLSYRISIEDHKRLTATLREQRAHLREAERQLRDTAAFQHAMLHGAGSAIIATDIQGVIQLFNPAAERLLGYTASEMVGQYTPDRFHDPEEVATRARELTIELGSEIEPGFETFAAKARLGQPDQREWTYIRSDGSRIPILLSITALTDAEGVIGFVGLAINLSEQKATEEKLRSALGDLGRLNRVMMNREERVLELKHEINGVCQEAGLRPRYPSALG